MDTVFNAPEPTTIVSSRDKSFANAVKVAISTTQSKALKKKVKDKIFTNESGWQNWPPGQNFQQYSR